MAQFKTLLTPNGAGGDYSAAVAVDYASMPPQHKCDAVNGAHAVFVKHYSTASGFLVYDPDNVNGCSQPRWWTESELTNAAYAYLNGGRVHCVVSRNEVVNLCSCAHIGESN
jgi:hypothetical protein